MPKSVDPLKKQQEFVAASIDVIAAHGLAGATMRRISDQAGCTTGALTHYFPNRNAILKQTLKSVHEQAGKRMLDVVAGDHDHLKKLHAVLLEALPLDDTRLTEWRVWLSFWGASMDDSELTAENRKRYREWSQLVSGLLAPMVRKQALADETERMVALVDGLGVGIVRQKTSARGLQQQATRCERLLHDHLRGLIDASGAN